MCRGKNRYVFELHLIHPGHNPTSSELLLERSVAKESEPCSPELEQSRIEETQFEIPTNHSEEVILDEERKWSDIPACKSFKGDSLQAEISKLVRRYGQENEKLTALFIGILWFQSCKKRLRSPGGENSRTHVLKEATR